MKKLRVSLVAIAFILATGASFATTQTLTFDCASTPNGTLTMNSSDCASPHDVLCCYIVAQQNKVVNKPL